MIALLQSGRKGLGVDRSLFHCLTLFFPPRGEDTAALGPAAVYRLVFFSSCCNTGKSFSVNSLYTID